jgi:hypothetical protein
LLQRIFYSDPGFFTINAVSGARFVRATALGCGGQGANWGGGGSLARSRFPVLTDGEAYEIRVGDTSTASELGDSFVRRIGGPYLVYADRGRGNGTGGRAANSIGDIKIDGQDGNSSTGFGGDPASDASMYAPVGISGSGYGKPSTYYYGRLTSDFGGGGLLSYSYRDNGEIAGTVGRPAGYGRVVMEYFNVDPGY